MNLYEREKEQTNILFMLLKKKETTKFNIAINMMLLVLPMLIALVLSTRSVAAKEVKAVKDGSAVKIQSIMEKEVLRLDRELDFRVIKNKSEAEEKERQAQKKRDDLLTYARQFIGNPYVLGGRSLTNGCDCSIFVILIYKEFGYNWPFGPVSTLINNCGGEDVSVDDLKEGDIIFFENMSHVAIYAGNGKIVHAMDPQNGITETVLFPHGDGRTYCGKSIIKIKRVLE